MTGIHSKMLTSRFKILNSKYFADFLVESLKDAIELVVNALIGSRDRQASNTSSLQTTSGVISCSDNDVTECHRRHDRPVNVLFFSNSDFILISLRSVFKTAGHGGRRTGDLFYGF